MAVEEQLIIWSILGFNAFLNVIFIYPVYKKLKDNEKSNMVRFRLNAEKTFTDFKIFLIATTFVLAAATSWFYTDYTGAQNTIGDILSILSGFIPLIIFYRWRKRFK